MRLSGGESHQVTKVEIIFYSSGGWKSNCPRRVADDGGADSMLRFRLERGDGGMKRL
jgi:hypothetical protein